MFKLNQEKEIKTQQEAIEHLSETLVSSNFLCKLQNHLNDDSFWDDVVVFCDKWNIPFYLDLQKNISLKVLDNLNHTADYMRSYTAATNGYLGEEEYKEWEENGSGEYTSWMPSNAFC